MHAARGFNRETGSITLASPATSRVDLSRAGRFALHVALLGKQVAKAPTPGRSCWCSGPAFPLTSAAHRTFLHRLPTCRRATHSGDSSRSTRKLAARPRAWSNSV